jgi:hypothetical protein
MRTDIGDVADEVEQLPVTVLDTRDRAGELAADLLIDDGPGDLSTNPKHMEGYGR